MKNFQPRNNTQILKSKNYCTPHFDCTSYTMNAVWDVKFAKGMHFWISTFCVSSATENRCNSFTGLSKQWLGKGIMIIKISKLQGALQIPKHFPETTKPLREDAFTSTKASITHSSKRTNQFIVSTHCTANKARRNSTNLTSQSFHRFHTRLHKVSMHLPLPC